MPEDTVWVAVVTLPERINSANADQVRKRLLWVIARGAAVLVADLTATLWCDYSGADALLLAYQHAVLSGTELRLVVVADAVRRSLSLNGLLSLAPMYPTPDAAVADRRESHRPPPDQLRTAALTPVPPGPGQAARTSAADPTRDPLDSALASISTVALSLQNATDLSRERIVQCITESVDMLDDAIRGIHEHARTEQDQGPQAAQVTRQRHDMHERVAQTAQRTGAVREQLVETARALHAASAETAALMTQRRSLTGEPHRIDYPTRIKRWQAIADAAQHMAERLEDN